jgi:enoyl-CoA hydratase
VAGAEGLPEPLLVERIELRPGRYAGLLTLNRPEALNALSRQLFLQLEAAVDTLDADTETSVILLTGKGRAFCAGGDLKAFLEIQSDPVAFPELMDRAHRVFAKLRRSSKPVVSLVNGIAAAGGLELMLSSDFCYAAESATVGDAHLKYGQMGGGGSLSLLPRLIGLPRARELIFSARLLSAQEALAWGLVNRVVPGDQLLEAGLDFAREAAELSPLALANAKHVVNYGWEHGSGVDTAMSLEVERTTTYCLTSEDVKEGLRAFRDKRPPRFRGR